MYRALENSLYKKDVKRFRKLQQQVIGFNAVNNGKNIIQDDIFLVMENYVKKQEIPLELLRFPIKDEEFCACTFIREARLFVLLNSGLPLSKQLFAAAHELYHIWCYFEDDEQSLLKNGSILKSATIDEEATGQEDREANAFAGLLLVSEECLSEQLRIYGIMGREIEISDVLLLMDIFAVPFKAMILRLYEEGYINEDQARQFFYISQEEIHRQCLFTGKGKRWQRTTKDVVHFGSLEEMLEFNESMGALTDSRTASDKRRISELKSRYTQN